MDFSFLMEGLLDNKYKDKNSGHWRKYKSREGVNDIRLLTNKLNDLSYYQQVIIYSIID